MLHKTVGIILHTTKYAESGFIIKLYTRDQGLQSCIINSGKSRRTRNKALFQPLALVDVVISSSPKSELKRISEISIHYPYTEIPFDMIKGSIAMFLNEMLYRSIKEAHPDEDLFDFIKSSLQILDLRTESSSSFHIFFLLQLSRYLGFGPQGDWTESTPVFDLQEGVFTGQAPVHSYSLDREASKALSSFINSSYDAIHSLKVSKDNRKRLLEALISFYRLHIPSFGEIRSHKILEEVIV